MRLNLLTDPLLRVEADHGLKSLSLPGLLAGLGENNVNSILGLQRYQEDSFLIFIGYLGSAALLRADRTDPIQTEAFWHDSLLNLSGGLKEAWCLVVDDATKPAFMQPPVANAEIAKSYKAKALTPDAIDILPTAKNHDVKSNRAESAEPEDWIYALVNLQTTAGFFGQGNYGIARMNGGFGSRPCIDLRYADSWGEVWQEAISRLLDLCSELLAGSWGYQPDGTVLTWLHSWDGKSSLSLSELNPLFIEICRAIRLVQRKEGIEATAMPTKAPRIAAKQLKGLLGDPWIPINSKKGSALTVSATGFTPGLLRDLLFEDGFELQSMQRPLPNLQAEHCRLHASVLVRGQGTTDGFHETNIPIPSRIAKPLFQTGPERDRLGELSKTGISDAGAMQNRVLRPALYSLLEGGPVTVDFNKREVSAWLNSATKGFADAWSSDFFPWLWRGLDQPDNELACLSWRRKLMKHGLASFKDSAARLPDRSGRHYRSRVRAESVFFGAMYKLFPELRERNHEQQSNN